MLHVEVVVTYLTECLVITLENASLKTSWHTSVAIFVLPEDGLRLLIYRMGVHPPKPRLQRWEEVQVVNVQARGSGRLSYGLYHPTSKYSRRHVCFLIAFPT